MLTMVLNNLILIGFDRSGTSAISKILAKHDEIELVYRPFNSGPIRHKMYKILDDSIVDKYDINFFKKLQDNVFDSSYVVSGWHKKYSTIKDDFIEGQLHVLITNLNHFSVKWVNDNFPAIEQWGIWRDPVEILNSCIKNNFYDSWYDDALEQVIKTVKKDSELKIHFDSFSNYVIEANDVIKTAFLIAVRNYFLFKHIDRKKVIIYEDFKANPNKALEYLLNHFGINKKYDFSPYLEIDLNTIPSADGYSKNKKRKFVLRNADLVEAKKMFEPLYEIFN